MNNQQQFMHSISPEEDINQLKQEIINKDSVFFTFDFKHAINEEIDNKKISIDEFWKLAKVKAKKVSLFVDEILSCEVLEAAPLGFIREITMPGSDVTQVNGNKIIHIKERVVIDDETKTLLFFQLETMGNILLFAINGVTEEKDNVYFSGHYVYSIQKDSFEKEDQEFMKGSNKVLPARVKDMISKMKTLAKSGTLEKVFQQLYG